MIVNGRRTGLFQLALNIWNFNNWCRLHISSCWDMEVFCTICLLILHHICWSKGRSIVQTEKWFIWCAERPIIIQFQFLKDNVLLYLLLSPFMSHIQGTSFTRNPPIHLLSPEKLQGTQCLDIFKVTSQEWCFSRKKPNISVIRPSFKNDIFWPSGQRCQNMFTFEKWPLVAELKIKMAQIAVGFPFSIFPFPFPFPFFPFPNVNTHLPSLATWSKSIIQIFKHAIAA